MDQRYALQREGGRGLFPLSTKVRMAAPLPIYLNLT